MEALGPPLSSRRMLLVVLLLLHGLMEQSLCQSDPGVEYVYYEYYYEDELPPTGAGDKVTEDVSTTSDYDINELLKAWKEYIDKKKKEEDIGSSGTGGRRPTGSRRPTGGRRPSNSAVRVTARPQQQQPTRLRRPEPVSYDYYDCEPRSESYRTADVEQCDKYFECNIKGEEKEHLCDDGLVYDEKSQNCDYPSKVDCGPRTKLQPPQPSKNCPRANGFFAWPAKDSCQKFWDCRGGQSYLQTCPEGVIFDMKVDACVTPDQSHREECKAEKFLKFDCPNYSAEEPLRFGNHDRLPDPENCQKFYSCLRDGQPRLGVCPRKTVFNNATGLCDDPKAVVGCETFWKDKEEAEFLDYYDY